MVGTLKGAETTEAETTATARNTQTGERGRNTLASFFSGPPISLQASHCLSLAWEM